MPTIVTDHEASPGQLPHTLEVERGIAVRLYLWTYAASAKNINTCKMFWAFVFMPLVLPFSVIIHGLARIVDWADGKLPESKGTARPYVPKPPKVGPSNGERFLEWVSGFMAKTWFRLQPLLKWGGILIGTIIGVVGLYLLATNAVVVGEFFVKVLIAGLIGAAAVAVLSMIVIGLDKAGVFGAFGRKIGGFFRLMRDLGRSVHDHTCANVKVKD